MDARTRVQYEWIEAILIAAHITNREDLRAYDKRGGKDGGVAGLKGIGRKRRKLIEAALQGTDAEWMACFPLIAPYAAIALEGHATTNNVPVTWYPAEGLLEGHSLTPPPPGDA